MEDFISTKLMMHVKDKLFKLGVKDISCSNSDMAIISAFAQNPHFAPRSAIGSVVKKDPSIKDELTQKILKEKSGKFIVLDTQNSPTLRFNKLGVVLTGDINKVRNVSSYDRYDIVINAIKRGLEEAMLFILKSNITSIDITAIGTKYGGIRSTEIADYLTRWSFKVLANTNVSVIRVVLNNIETFSDFVEIMWDYKGIIETLGTLVVDKNKDYNGFNSHISEILNASTPDHVLVTCRKITEKIVNNLAELHGIRNKGNLYGKIHSIRNYIPIHIYSYLESCRIMGNYGAHPAEEDNPKPFKATNKDAYAVSILTLKILEWYLEKYNIPN